MSPIATGPGSATAQWLHGLWEYYREYTHTAVHTASAAALAAFGLLIFIDPLFVVLAIASYIVPPLVLYSIGANVEDTSDSSKRDAVPVDGGTNSDDDSDTPPVADADTDSGSDDGDTDSDSDDGDTDSDSADGDTDGGDSDTDTDG